MSRIKKTIKNAKVGVFFLIISTVIGFYSRKVFLDILGDDFVGLTTVLYTFIGMLSIAELGIATAITSVLYKPLYVRNESVICDIISFLGHIYKIISGVILVLAFILSLFFPFIFDDAITPIYWVYILFYSFLISVFIDYYFNFKQTLIIADQKVHIVTKLLQTSTILKLLIQIVIIVLYESIIGWALAIIVFSILNSYWLNSKISKEYEWLKPSNKSFKELLSDNQIILQKVKQLVIHKVGGFISGASDNLFIFIFANIALVAHVGNYQLILVQITALIKTAGAGVNASVGSLVAENNVNKLIKTFDELNSIRWIVSAVFVSCLFILTPPFITLWIGEKYILDESVFVVLLMILTLNIVRGTVDNYINAYGLFHDTKAPIFEIGINIAISIIFGYYWGILGVMLGTFISLFIIVGLWKPYFLYSTTFKKNYKYYVVSLIKNIVIFLLSICSLIISVNSLKLSFTNFYDWLVNAMIIVTIALFYSSSIFSLLDKEFRNLIRRFLFKT